MKLTGESKVFLGILVATIAIIGVAVFFFSKPTPPPKPLSREELVAADSFTIGNATAAAFLVEFSDFQCPACRAFAPTVEGILTQHKDNLLFVYRHFPLPQHQYAKTAAMVAEAAGVQGKFWEMGKLLFANQDRFPTTPWASLADELKLDLTKFDKSINSEILKSKIDRDEAKATQLGLSSTPSFFLNGVLLDIANPNDLKAAVEEAVQ